MDPELQKIDYLLGDNLVTHDPYDLWKTKLGLQLKKIYYRNGKIAIPLVAPFYLLDSYFPKFIRIFIRPQEFPTVRAFAALSSLTLHEITGDNKYLRLAAASVEWLLDHQSEEFHGACWGLNMPWMTKTGFFPATTPFITHTPYCVEALLKYSDITGNNHIRDVALSSLNFLDYDLKVLLENRDELALSYGTNPDRCIVINANAYAMMMYALLASRLSTKRSILMEKARRIFNFVSSRQNGDGSWFYYNGYGERGNFIDCFHSCFVLKNLIKYAAIAEVDVTEIVQKGLHYILENFMDRKYFLARRFSVSANPSFTKFDLYDQAELLNVLCLTRRFDLAQKLHDAIAEHFYIPGKRSFGFQIDIFGKLNKMKYLRWAIMPTLFALSQYYKLKDSIATSDMALRQFPESNKIPKAAA